MPWRRLLLILLFPLLSFARGSLSGYCTQGGQKVFQNGVPSTTQVMQSYPQCAVTVYNTGGPAGTVTTSGTAVTWVTGTPFNSNGQWSGLIMIIDAVSYTISSCSSDLACTLTTSPPTFTTPVTYAMAVTSPAAIYTSTGTVLTNPFVASAQGYWQFYADNGQYDIRLSGGGIPAPFTWGGQDLIDPLSLPNTISDLVCTTAGCLATLCSTAVSLHRTLTLSRMWDLDGTCAASIYAYEGGGFSPTTGHTSTLTGPFDGDGTLHFDTAAGGSVALTLPTVADVLWFGASTSSADNSSVVAAALATIPATGGTISFPCGDFKGMVTFPQYPKSVTVEGAGQCTILEEPTANSGIVSSSPPVVNFTSGSNVLRNVSLKPHDSSTTSKAVDMRGQNDGIYQDLWFVPASNSTGHFGWGFYCSTATGTACYGNTVDHVWAFIQVGPTIMVETEEFAAVNTFSRFHIVDLTATTDIFFLNSPNNKIVSTDIEGNASATVLRNSGGYNRVEGPTDWEANNREIVGEGNGYQLVVEGGSIGPGITSTITCTDNTSAWDFRNVAGIDLTSQLVGCVNAKVTHGSSIDGFAPKYIIGGLTTNRVTSGTGQSVSVITGLSGGLAAGTYTWDVTVTTAGGESLPIIFGPTTLVDHSGVILFFNGNATVPYYTIYGRNCPTTATCKVLAVVPPEGNSGGGMFFDDGTVSPSGNSPTLTRDSTGDLNVNGGVGGDGGTASYIYTSGPINYGTETGTDTLLVWNAQNGPAFTFQAFAFAPAFTICTYTQHALQAGQNTIALYNSQGVLFGGPFLIRKGTDYTADLTTPIAAGNMVCLIYNTAKNVFQYQGQ